MNKVNVSNQHYILLDGSMINQFILQIIEELMIRQGYMKEKMEGTLSAASNFQKSEKTSNWASAHSH